jgi:two-component system, LytTR family, response regulator
MIRALIVDDERLARSELRRLLAIHAEIEIVGEAANIADAERAINELQPELLFLDVQMPGGSGFDLLAALDDAPEVIFTTAFDAYALRAFEVNALDYLQKPIEGKRLAAALMRAQSRIAKNQVTLKPDNKIFIKDGERCWFVALTDISLFESEGNYARVYFQTEAGQHRPLILRSLNQLEVRLDQTKFFRANRRQIINLDFIKRVAPADAGGLSLVLQNDLIIDLSRRRAMEFRAMSSL